MIPDPLDARLGHAGPSPQVRRRRGARLALGLSPMRVPGVLLLPFGVALGPQGLGLLSPTVLSFLDPAVSVAMATLGVFVGLGLDLRRAHETRLLAAASIEAALTVALVVAGVWLALGQTPFDTGFTPWLFAALLGICAASSSTTAVGETEALISGSRPGVPPVDEYPRAAVLAPAAPAARADVNAARIGDLDDVLTIIAGGVVLACIRTSDVQAGAWLAVQSGGVAVLLACAGWLLVAQAASDSERRVFVLGILLLLGGAVEYLSLSALFAGLADGAVWNAAGGTAVEHITRDVRHVQHPLIVLLLLTAGAHFTVWEGLALLVPVYLLFRIGGKVAGGWLAGKIAGHERPVGVGLYLVSPGMIAVALALNALQAAGPQRGGLLLAAAVAGSFVSELISLAVHPREAAR